MQTLHSLAFASISRWICGHQTFCASESIAKLDGYVEWMSSNTASCIAFDKAIHSSRQIRTYLTLRSRQHEKMYGLIFRNLSGPSLSIQSRTFTVMASSFLLTTLLIVSMKQRSSAASITLRDGVVFVLDEVFVVFVDSVVSEKVTRAFVGVDLFIFALGILLIE